MKKTTILVLLSILYFTQTQAQTPTTVAPNKAFYDAHNIAPTGTGSKSFAILAAGDATSFINAGNNNPGASTTGSLGFRHTTEKRSLSLLLRLASTTEPLTRGWATSIISPLASQSSTIGSVVVDGYFKLNQIPRFNLAADNWDINAYIGFTSSSWQTDSVKKTVNNVSLAYAGLLMSYTIYNDKIGNTPVSSSVKFGLTSRFIGGDITNLSGTDSLNVKTYMLPTTKKAWISPEIDLLISIGKISGKFQATWFSDASLGNKNASKGFTRMQLSFGLNVSIEAIEQVF